ncbi:hypothetical protein ASG43_19195 [Aureimonas sp. Leaf454]|uniref:hypothetical protein n=1 Tax=Aureimonas sp. Leaf454 TaxID=1736381 RepID=UPI0006F3A899|nr:hypothetical protein [Aureimonas sp. Leaf454]KQT53110.1 hypothetical protein ASG43_19195 [Aureimonas sp. Leaf454]
MTDRDALLSMLIYARREAEEESLPAVAYIVSLAIEEMERNLKSRDSPRRSAALTVATKEIGPRTRPIISRLQ